VKESSPLKGPLYPNRGGGGGGKTSGGTKERVGYGKEAHFCQVVGGAEDGVERLAVSLQGKSLGRRRTTKKGKPVSGEGMTKHGTGRSNARLVG